MYVKRLLLYQSLNLFLVSVLAVFVQVLTNNKYFGMLLMVLYIVSIFVMDNIGLEHDLYQYAGRPATPLSDMNASGHFIWAGLWLNLYWSFFAVILAVMAYLMWNRGAAGECPPALGTNQGGVKHCIKRDIAGCSGRIHRQRIVYLLQHQCRQPLPHPGRPGTAPDRIRGTLPSV